MRKTREIYRLVNATRGAVVAARVRRARGWWERLIGLTGRRGPSPDDGLWLDPCNGVHTFGMRFSIDLLVLDGEGRVLRLITELAPLRVTGPVKGGRSTVEMAAGALARTGTEVGDLMRWEKAEH